MNRTPKTVTGATLRALFLTAAAVCGCCPVESQPVDEYQVKAAFLLNFAKFVEWPATTFKTPGNPISICVLGTNPFGRSLEEAASGKSMDGRKFAVRQIGEMGQASGCQILFVPSQQKKGVQEASPPGVLIVGESEGFASCGGIIGFKLDSGRVRLEINVEAAERRNLRISSKLLSLAQIVKSGS
jgi:hypothetical protein